MPPLPATAEAHAAVAPRDDAPNRPPAGPAAPLLFDVCHVAVVLRTLVIGHLLLALGSLFAARDAAAWLGLLLNGSATLLPGLLLWLLLSCGLKAVLARWTRIAQAAASAVLGSFSAGVGWAFGLLGTADTSAAPGFGGPLPALLCGAVAGWAMFHWLALRAQGRLPADTTARLAELQSRIRPHFLFNTLNTALSLVRLDPARAEGVLEDLSELFRAALADDTAGGRADGSVTLAEEVELAQRYLAIEQIRFGERLRLSWDLDPAAAAARVPRLLLQPLVENAVRHGVEPSADGGSVRVRTQVRLGRAVLGITNSVAEAPSVPGHGIALRNTRERLRLMHDMAASLEVQREAGEFRVRIEVPL